MPASDFDQLRAEMLRNDPEFRQLWEASASKRAIAIALVRARKQAGLTQSDLAKKAGWDKAFVSRLEGAAGPVPDTATLMRYATACDRAVGLVFGSPEERSTRVIDAVTLAPQGTQVFERLRGVNLESRKKSRD
jgi:transcriptional regulator with XRE-family HTH domain